MPGAGRSNRTDLVAIAAFFLLLAAVTALLLTVAVSITVAALQGGVSVQGATSVQGTTSVLAGARTAGEAPFYPRTGIGWLWATMVMADLPATLGIIVMLGGAIGTLCYGRGLLSDDDRGDALYYCSCALAWIGLLAVAVTACAFGGTVPGQRFMLAMPPAFIPRLALWLGALAGWIAAILLILVRARRRIMRQ